MFFLIQIFKPSFEAVTKPIHLQLNKLFQVKTTWAADNLQHLNQGVLCWPQQRTIFQGSRIPWNPYRCPGRLLHHTWHTPVPDVGFQKTSGQNSFAIKPFRYVSVHTQPAKTASIKLVQTGFSSWGQFRLNIVETTTRKSRLVSANSPRLPKIVWNTGWWILSG